MPSIRAEPTRRVGALLLAAGGAQRFGGGKLRARLGGRTLVGWALEAAVDAGLDPIVVVIGGDPDVRGDLARVYAEAGIDATDVPPIEVIENGDWSRGIATSVQLGLDVISRAHGHLDAVCILHADQPAIGPAVLRRLVAASRRDTVAVATFDGQRRNPVVVGAELWPSAVDLVGDTGFRALFGELPVVDVPCDHLGDPTDVDTPDDLDRLARRWDTTQHEPGPQT